MRKLKDLFKIAQGKLMRSKNKNEPSGQNSPRTLVRVYNMILTFDTDVPNEKLESEIESVIEKINLILSKEIKDSLPQIFKNVDKESLISISYNREED